MSVWVRQGREVMNETATGGYGLGGKKGSSR